MARGDAVTFARRRKLTLAGGMQRRIDPSVLETAVGATETSPAPAQTDTPLGFVAVRQELAGALRSTGGRPGFPDAQRRRWRAPSWPSPSAPWPLRRCERRSTP
jgi:hypothetical protein